MSWSNENGYSHRCICGKLWYDSDGEPCHVRCPECDNVISTEDTFDNFLCEKCHDLHAVEMAIDEVMELLDDAEKCL